MRSVPLDDLLAELNSIPQRHFDFETVSDCLHTHPVEENSLRPYLLFHPSHPTRNLIFKNDTFELLASCWDIGQASPVQAYPGRNIWIKTCNGQLRLQTFRVAEEDEHRCRLVQQRSSDLKKNWPAVVSASDPVHQILNIPRFGQRAVSLHVYSPPVSEQVTYSLEAKRPVTSIPNYDTHHGRRDMPD
jgi:cysteine dioxygenase